MTESLCTLSSSFFSGCLLRMKCRFGGTDGQYHYNDMWAFDLNTRRWSELPCIGFIPAPREGHAAALVDDVMYVFGGRGVDGQDLKDLAAFKISSEHHHHFYFLRISCSQIYAGTCSRIWDRRLVADRVTLWHRSGQRSLFLVENRSRHHKQTIRILSTFWTLVSFLEENIFLKSNC